MMPCSRYFRQEFGSAGGIGQGFQLVLPSRVSGCLLLQEAVAIHEHREEEPKFVGIHSIWSNNGKKNLLTKYTFSLEGLSHPKYSVEM